MSATLYALTHGIISSSCQRLYDLQHGPQGHLRRGHNEASTEMRAAVLATFAEGQHAAVAPHLAEHLDHAQEVLLPFAALAQAEVRHAHVAAPYSHALHFATLFQLLTRRAFRKVSSVCLTNSILQKSCAQRINLTPMLKRYTLRFRSSRDRMKVSTSEKSLRAWTWACPLGTQSSPERLE